MNQLLRELRRRRRAPGPAGRRPGPGTPGARWRGWARSLAARRRRTAAAGSFAGMVLLRGAASAVGDTVRLPPASHAWHLYLTLHRACGPAAPTSADRLGALLVSRVHVGPRAVPAVPAVRPVPLAAAAAGGSMAAAQARVVGERWRTVRPTAGGAPAGEPTAAWRAVPRQVTGDTVTAAVRHTVQRVLERGRRVEERTAAAPVALRGGGGRDGGWAHGLPPMAVTRQPPLREPGGGAAGAHGRGAAGGGPPDQSDPWQAPGAPPRIDVEQLADQVVRRIDDRIIAHRERLGRI